MEGEGRVELVNSAEKTWIKRQRIARAQEGEEPRGVHLEAAAVASESEEAASLCLLVLSQDSIWERGWQGRHPPSLPPRRHHPRHLDSRPQMIVEPLLLDRVLGTL